MAPTLRDFVKQPIRSTRQALGLQRQPLLSPVPTPKQAPTFSRWQSKRGDIRTITKNIPDLWKISTRDVGKLRPSDYAVLSPKSLRRGSQMLTQKMPGATGSLEDRANQIQNPNARYAAQFGVGLTDELLKQHESGFRNTAQGPKDIIKSRGRSGYGKALGGLWQLTKTPRALAYGGVPFLVAGGIGGGFSTIMDPNDGVSAGRNFLKGGNTRAVTGFTDPYISQVLGKMNYSNPIIQQLAMRNAAGLMNVGEDEIINRLDQVPTTNRDRAMSFGIGTLTAGNSELFKSLRGKGGTPKVEAPKSGPSEKLTKDKDGILRNKEGRAVDEEGNYVAEIYTKGKGKNKKRYYQIGNFVQQVHDTAKAAMEHKKSYGIGAAERVIKEVKDGKQRGYIIVPKNYQFDGTEGFAGVAGGLTGFEMGQDEDGKMKINYNPERGMIGVAAGIGGKQAVNAIKNQNIKLSDLPKPEKLGDAEAGFKAVGDVIKDKIDRTKLSGIQLSKTNAELQANQKLLPENATTPDVKTPSLTRSDALERAGVQDGGGSVLDKLSADFKAGRKLREKIGKVSTKDWIQSHLLDRFQPAKKYDENFFKNMRLLAGGGKARTEQIITENIGPALQRHRDRLEGLSQFMAIERMNELVNIRGLKRSLSDTEIAKGRQELLDRYGPEVVAEFDQSAKEIRTFMSKTLDAAVQSGLISKEAAEAAKTKNQMYVTFETLGQLAWQDGDNPNFSSASFNTAKQNVLKQIGDSETGIADPLESTLAKVMNTISELDKNSIVRDFVENADENVVRQLKSTEKPPLGMGKISVFVDGKKRDYAVPKELEIAVKNLDDSGFHWVVKMLNYPVRALKTGAVVINPEFFAVNPIRDLQDALFGEASVGGIKQSGKILGNYSKAIAETSGMGKEWEAWRKAGGGNSTFLNQEVRKSPQKTVKDLANQNRPRFMGTKKPSEILDWISRTSEESTRMSKFRTDVGSQKNEVGEVIPFAQVDKKLRDAAFASREITLDFAKMGSASRVLNQLIPFFNVSLIGTEKFFKLAKDNPANFAKAMTVYAGVPAVSLYLWNSQFEDFKDMRDFEKESNLVFMTGERSEKEKADNAPIKAFTLPMGNLSQPFFQTVNSLMSFTAKRDPSKLASLGADLIEGWSPVGFPVSEDRTRRFLSNVTPQALKTPIENFSNKNLYTGFDIEPNYINGVPREDVPAQYRDSKYTGPTAKAIGRVTGQLPGILQMSPAQVQNAVGTNFGGAGKTLMTGTDALLGTPPKDVSQVPFVKRFYGPSGGQIRSEEWEQASKEKQKTIKGMFKGTPIRDNAVMAAEESMAGDSEAVKKISDKIEYRPESVSPEEYYTYYMRDISPEPGKNRYEEEIRQDEIFSRLNTIEESDNLDDASKFRLQTSLLETAGVPRGAYDYYKVAKQDDTRKTMYVLDQLDRFQSRDQLIRYLASGRAKIRNSQVVTQGVLTNLRDDGIISDAEYKQLNALKSTSDGRVFLPASKKKGKALVTDSQYRTKQASYIKKLGSTSPNYAKYGTIGSSGRNNLSSGRYSLR